MSDHPKTCLEIWRDYNLDWDTLREKYHADIRKAIAREFPIGAQVTFAFGSSKVECTVVKHGEYAFQSDRVVVRNNKTKKEWDKEVRDLTPVPAVIQP